MSWLDKMIEEDFWKHPDINDPQFDKATRVHDWRNYVPELFQEHWAELSEQTRKCIFVMAEQEASNEEWE